MRHHVLNCIASIVGLMALGPSYPRVNCGDFVYLPVFCFDIEYADIAGVPILPSLPPAKPACRTGREW
jgi:hypothetical protein